MTDKIQIRNSTADFLVFTKQNGEDSIEVRVQNENVWLTQKAIANLFDVQVPAISKHLSNIFEKNELQEISVISILETTAADGKKYDTKYYNLDAIISVGYRINSERATQFRQWATRVLRTFAVQGYVLDKKRLENGQIFSQEYFDHLLEEIQEIRASERLFYQKITDIYATAVDYSLDAKTTKNFFALVQNKLHFATHGHTAAELIMKRANQSKENMGLTTWKNAPQGKILKSDVSVAKNYLSMLEMKDLNEIVSMYLDYAARQARRQIPMTMEDWAKKLDVFLELNDEVILKGTGKITHEIAKAFAESEFEQYRVIQDKTYQSDFDKILSEMNE